jgi:arsenate reductase
MKKIFHLSSCNTNQKILQQLKIGNDVELQDIKQKNIDVHTLDWIKEKVGSYEALFSKKAIKFRSLGLHEKQLSEEDYRNLILDEYTFLKRPFIINEDQVFIGNNKDTVAAAVQSFAK